MRRRKNKIKYFTTQASNISVFSKIVIVILVIGMLMNHMNLGILAKAFEPEVHMTITDDVERDFSEFDKIEELNSLRTANSKTYIKENGMYETEYYGEKIHYKDKDNWKEIDNSLFLKDNNRYYNNSNKYNISFPNKLNKNNGVVLNYLNNEIKIYYDTEKDINAKLNDNIDRTKKNTKDEISYYLSSKEIIQYVIKQDSIKENIILKSYIENYNYSYYIDTDLRIERIGNELYFYNGQTEVFVMNEYYMYDANNNASKEIYFEIISIDENTYKVEVTPSDEYLKNATYPVVIDPEINLIDGGILDGVTWLLSIDKQSNTAQHLDIGSFVLANRSNLSENDDKVAYLELYIPREYDKNIGDIITQNQLMYANLTLITVSSINVSAGSKVNLKYATSFNWPDEDELPTYDTENVDSQHFHGTTVFNHKFDILEGITARLEDFKTEDIRLGFELSLDANENAQVSYSLGLDLGGDKPLITLGYIADAGLADYYTYESLPISDDSEAYISHNSGNLTYVYNDYNDNNLLNLSHIYNANRKHNNSQYGNGFSLNYEEKITSLFYNSKLLLTEGDGREIIFYTQNDTNTEYLAGDGSGEFLYRLVDENNITTGYKIETADGGLKIYDVNGKLKTIYIDKEQYNNQSTDEDVVVQKIDITYNTDGTFLRIDDSYGNYMLFNYLIIANVPTEEQQGIPYLAYINIYKYIPEEDTIRQAEYIDFIYDKGNLQNIGKFGTATSNCTYTYFTYNANNHLQQISKNGRGYTFEYDIKNRITKAKVYSTEFTNGDYLIFEYDSNGKKTKVTNGSGDSTSYTFDDYYHTNSIETSTGYTTFYKYQDIYYNINGTLTESPNYNKNHKIILQSNSFKNVGNPINNHGFEIIESGGISGWKTELTYNSTASINTSIYLYGSKVLELYRKSSGTAKAYQEISVKEGQTYIVTGYIRNENNTGNGAYIEVVGTDGTITYLSSSNNVLNTTNFVRYEYKFTANYSGKAKVYLVNASNGKAYFDNIQVNTNYVDTRYNYLENSSFEVDTLYDFYDNEENIEDNKLTSESISGKFNINYAYTNDSYRQLEIISYYITTLPIESKYTYETTVNPNDNKTYYTGRIKELEYTNGSNQIIKYVYEYDDYSNISKIYGYQDGEQTYYEENNYDIFNQLETQTIIINNITYVSDYDYDSRGNVIGYYSQGPNVSYSGEFFYDDNDQMTDALINGSSYEISYSSTGQPSVYLGWEIDYEMRNICVIENEDYYVEYYYNANGIRTGKCIDNGSSMEYVNYVLDGSNIIREIHTGANYYNIEYYYDSSDNIIGFAVNGAKYLFLKNLQNDVIGIVDSSNNLVVEYYYDAYGRIIKINDTSGFNLSTFNPFRYRSYYQDNETGWYYLNSRYYDPLTNRFITMDQIEYLGSSGSVLSYNLYMYCLGNPINQADVGGNFPVHIVAGVIAGVAWGVIPRIINDVIKGKMSRISDYLCDAISGGLSGLVASLTGSSTLGTLIGTFVGEMARFLIDYAPKFKLSNFKDIVIGFVGVIIKTAIATVSSFVAGKIINKVSKKIFSPKQIKNYFKNTKYLKSAFGIGSGGKTTRRMWFYDMGITTILYNFLT